MMKKGIFKIISIISIIMCIALSCATFVYADGIDITTLGDGELTQQGRDEIVNYTNIIATIIRNVGIVLSVAILTVLGIKYLTGSIEEKADFKKSAIPYVVGAIVLFGASGIAQLVISVTGSITNK